MTHPDSITLEGNINLLREKVIFAPVARGRK